MLITRKSPITGKEHTIDVDITPTQLNAWKTGMLIQHAMPGIPASQREFIISGMTPEEWEDTFGKADDLLKTKQHD